MVTHNFYFKIKELSSLSLIPVSFFALSVAGCQHTTRDPESSQYLKIAQEMHRGRNYDTALGFYSRILEKNPEDKEARLGIIKMLKETGKTREAVKELQILLKVDPRDQEAQAEMCRLYIDLNQGVDAQRIANDLCEKDPENAAYINLLAVSHDLMGDHSKAQVLYQKALSIDASNLPVQSNLGLSYALSGDSSRSIALLEHVVKRPQATSKDRQNLAVSYALAGLMPKARMLFRKDLSEGETKETLRFLQSIHRKVPTRKQPNHPKPHQPLSKKFLQPSLQKPLSLLRGYNDHKKHI